VNGLADQCLRQAKDRGGIEVAAILHGCQFAEEGVWDLQMAQCAQHGVALRLSFCLASAAVYGLEWYSLQLRRESSSRRVGSLFLHSKAQHCGCVLGVYWLPHGTLQESGRTVKGVQLVLLALWPTGRLGYGLWQLVGQCGTVYTCRTVGRCHCACAAILRRTV
jgi:hypothetical protein